MAKEKKKREQYNWKFNEETAEFHEWFNNQKNIGDSLRTIVYHMIDLYGTVDITNPLVQKKIITDSIILQHFDGRDILTINTNEINGFKINSNEISGEPSSSNKSEPKINQEKSQINDKKNRKNKYNVDKNLL